MKPKLKPPGTKRPKLKCDILLSTFAFSFDLRRYSKGPPYSLLQKGVDEPALAWCPRDPPDGEPEDGQEEDGRAWRIGARHVIQRTLNSRLLN